MQPTKFAEEMREALGAESAGLWVFFMDKVRAILPFLMNAAGRPKAEIVQASVIGQAGFSSWSEMIEASPEKGGLGWSVDSWKAWKRAYTFIQEYEYLRSLELTASEINTLSREIQPFPETVEALEAAKSKRKNELEAKRGNSVSALSSQLNDCRESFKALEAKLNSTADERDSHKEAFKTQEREYVTLSNRHQQALGKLKLIQKRLVKLEGSVTQKNTTIANQKQELERYSQMTWLDHLKAIFGN